MCIKQGNTDCTKETASRQLFPELEKEQQKISLTTALDSSTQPYLGHSNVFGNPTSLFEDPLYDEYISYDNSQTAENSTLPELPTNIPPLTPPVPLQTELYNSGKLEEQSTSKSTIFKLISVESLLKDNDPPAIAGIEANMSGKVKQDASSSDGKLAKDGKNPKILRIKTKTSVMMSSRVTRSARMLGQVSI